MLPDLWRMADRAMRARRAPELRVGDDREPASELLTGVLHHLEADRWFHQTNVFKEGERTLARELLTVGVPKLVLFAHPAWEMCLDGALLLSLDFDEARAKLFEDVLLATPGLDAVAQQHGADALPHRDGFRKRFERILAAVTEGRWIGSYRSGAGLAQCLGGIRKRFALPPWSEEEESVTALILEDALGRAVEGLTRLESDRASHRAGRCAKESA
jgi:hypothetical protein